MDAMPDECTTARLAAVTAGMAAPHVLVVRPGDSIAVVLPENVVRAFPWERLSEAVETYLKDTKDAVVRYEVAPHIAKHLRAALPAPGAADVSGALLVVYDATDNAQQKPAVEAVAGGAAYKGARAAVEAVAAAFSAVHAAYTSRKCVFLCRHGIRQDYKDLEWVPNAKYPHDPPLSSEGVQQAKDIAKRLRHENIDLIVSSPFYRATMTAKFIAEDLGIKYVVEPAFGEFLSVKNRRAVPDLDPEPFEQDAAMDKSFEPFGKALSLETWESMQERVLHSLNAIMQQYNRIAIVSHRSTFQALMSSIVGSKFKYPLDFASVTSVLPSRDAPSGWAIDRINMYSHLTVFVESPFYNPNYAKQSYKDMLFDESGRLPDS